MDDAKTGRRVIRRLSEYPDLFPNLRYLRAGRDWMGNVCWGVPEPPIDMIYATGAQIEDWHRRCGQLYGYTEEAIGRMRELAAR